MINDHRFFGRLVQQKLLHPLINEWTLSIYHQYVKGGQANDQVAMHSGKGGYPGHTMTHLWQILLNILTYLCGVDEYV